MINAYCVLDGLNGLYMPNSAIYFTSKREAMSYAAEQARQLRDDSYIVIGNALHGYEYGYADASDPIAYALYITVESFTTRAERDQFIEENSEF